MTVAEAIAVQADYDIKSQDIRQYYASFTRRALPEGAIWRLSLATSCLPSGHPGYMTWMTMVSGTDRFVVSLQDWAIGLGATIARMKPRLRKRARVYVTSYDHEWGKQASLDGLCIALFGADKVPAVLARADEFKCDRDAYQRIRDFVAGALLLAQWQYEDSLRWAHKVARDS
ncbi:MAG TPA: hypothetical protein VIT62_10965 [Lysobacter sp.]